MAVASRAVPDGASARRAGQPAFISVAIPTCNRPDDLTRCLASLAPIRYPRWEVIVIDQSDGDGTRKLAMAWTTQVPSLVYLRLQEKNLSAARNMAIEHCAGEILAFIDDDCTVSTPWLDQISAAFEGGEAQVIFGAVDAGEHDPALALVTTASIRHAERLHGPLGAVRLRGMGASMYLRVRSTGPVSFDVSLGTGSRFHSGEDLDYALRVLAAGGTVEQRPEIMVTHHGERPYAGGVASSLTRNYHYGLGACHAKLLRCGAWSVMLPVIVSSLFRITVALRPLNYLRGRTTHGGRLVAYVRGLKEGLITPVDRFRGTFRRPGIADVRAS